MSLRDRLSRLTGEGTKTPAPGSRQETISELRQRVDALMTRREGISRGPVRSFGPAVPLEHLVTGEEVEMPQGRFFFSRSRLEGSHVHGLHRVCDLASLSMEAAGILAGSSELGGSNPTDALFLDTETTGLAGGTGTFPFLIGIGWFEHRDFITCQLFARDYSEEKAMLAFLGETAAEKRFLVTFNGRSFDVGLLAARFILNRIPDPLAAMPHLDLLHPSRRLVGHRLENSRLVTLEEFVLGLKREDDIPGQEIPQRYFDWLKRRDGRLLEGVFRHNRLDIVSMASLARHLADLLESPHGHPHAHESDLLSAARLLLDRGRTDQARLRLEALADSGDPDVALSALKSLSLIHKKAGQWDRAAGIWEAMVSRDPLDVFAVEELAKWCEHRSHAFGRAALLVERVLGECGTLASAEQQALAHRLERLLRKASLTGP
ncbi:MAG: ribonuclease H-like domain-containing protein [Syntrophaceae bacterium]|nr:ribonuclease H-like domain-containing protein [Deltaproteobacteria bacterium]